MTKYAYVRVSTKDQNIDRQLMALEPTISRRKTSFAIISPEKILSGRSTSDFSNG